MSYHPAAPLPAWSAPPAEKRSRRWLTVGIVLLALAGVLVIGDRAAGAYTENRIAQQIQRQGFDGRPDVSIQGFPFLTQLAGREFHEVNISAGRVSEGPVEIRTLSVALRGVRLNSGFDGGTIDRLDGTALIPFAGLVRAAGGPGVTASAAGRDEIKLTVDLGIVSGSAIARVTRAGTDKIRVRVISADGLPSGVLGSLADFTVTLPALPMGMSLQGISVSGEGIRIHVTGAHVAFRQ